MAETRCISKPKIEKLKFLTSVNIQPCCASCLTCLNLMSSSLDAVHTTAQGAIQERVAWVCDLREPFVVARARVLTVESQEALKEIPEGFSSRRWW